MTNSDSSPRFLITGGAGFIGSRLAARLSDHGPVTVFDNFHPQVHDGNPANRARLDAHGIAVIEGDIRDATAVAAAVRDSAPTIIYHLAAETGTGQSFDLVTRYNDVNVMGTAHLIEAIRAHGPDVTRVILAGSRSVYGEGACVDASGQPTPAVERLEADLAAGHYAPKDAKGQALTPVASCAETCPVAPASVYASTKLMQEYLLTQAFWGTGVEVGILRLQNVYGPGQSLNNPYTGVLSIFTRQIMEGKTLNIYEDGEITRDFVIVEDVAAAFAAMGTIDQMPGGIIDIGSGEAADILGMARQLMRLLEKPDDRYEITGAYRPGDIRYAVADITRAAEQLNWHPQVSLDQGLAALVEWSKDTINAES